MSIRLRLIRQELDLVFRTQDKDLIHLLDLSKQVTVLAFSASLRSPNLTSCSFLALLTVVLVVIIQVAGNQKSLTCCSGRRKMELNHFVDRARYC